jgi:hypothetical protein
LLRSSDPGRKPRRTPSWCANEPLLGFPGGDTSEFVGRTKQTV